MAPSSKRNAGAVSLLGQVLYLLTVVDIVYLPSSRAVEGRLLAMHATTSHYAPAHD
jgi:hypothetical protein